jgi:hypothetical protein
VASFQADTGLTGSVVGSLFGGSGTAVAPPRTAVPEGPTTVTAAAYGGASAGGGGGMQASGTHALISGIVAFALLGFLWLTLPR